MIHVLPWPFVYRCARSEKIEFCHASGMKKRYSNLSEADDSMTTDEPVSYPMLL